MVDVLRGVLVAQGQPQAAVAPAGAMPIAVSTCEGSADPVVQAEPLDAATSCQVELQQDRLALDIVKDKAGVIGQPLRGVPGELGVRDA